MSQSPPRWAKDAPLPQTDWYKSTPDFIDKCQLLLKLRPDGLYAIS